MKKRNVSCLTILVVSLIVSACSRNESPRATINDELTVGENGFLSPEKSKPLVYSKDEAQNAEMLKLRKKIGYLLLVEQFSTKIFESMKKAIKEHPPGGIVYWNPDKVGAFELAQVNSEYSIEAEKNNLGPLLLSTDYEGGGNSLTTSGKSIPGIQRYTQGFTKLVHPSWLGLAMKSYGLEMCELHGKIMARELKKAGINYPLATVSDLAKNYFIVRGISKNPQEIILCMQQIVKAFSEEKNMILVTKHFPGLGDTMGDTHDGTVVSRAQNRSELEPSLKPFSELIRFSNELERPETYSILASHAKYIPLDNQNLTTVSKNILTDFLRDELKFKGLVLSDAMWMGEYGKLNTKDLLVVYLKSILAGMDLLMIAGKTFAPSIEFFRNLFDGTTDSALRVRLETELSLPYEEIRRLYLERLNESVQRIEKVKTQLVYAHHEYDVKNYQVPKSFTTVLTERYEKILQQLMQGRN